MNNQRNLGLLLALLCYIVWGALTYYWHLLDHVPSFEVFAYRVVFSVIFMLGYFLLTGKRQKLTRETKAMVKNKKSLSFAVAASILLGFNWATFIYAVSINEATQASIANFIMPIISIILAVIFLREHMEKYMWASVILALLGVAVMIFDSGRFPLLTVLMSLFFPIYGLLKKYYSLSSDVAMVVESLILLPFILIYLIFMAKHQLWDYSPLTILGLIGAGPATTIPLLLFAESLKRAPIHMISFIQYVNPTLGLLISVTLLAEPLAQSDIISLIFIWLGILVFLAGQIVTHRRKPLHHGK